MLKRSVQWLLMCPRAHILSWLYTCCEQKRWNGCHTTLSKSIPIYCPGDMIPLSLLYIIMVMSLSSLDTREVLKRNWMALSYCISHYSKHLCSTAMGLLVTNDWGCIQQSLMQLYSGLTSQFSVKVNIQMGRCLVQSMTIRIARNRIGRE